jgi:hypothetical protein
MGFMEILNIIGFAMGVFGLGFGFWQQKTARKTKAMYREKCATRCKDLVETVGGLDEAATQACRIKLASIDEYIGEVSRAGKDIRPLRELSDQIHSIYVLKKQLVRFCERLNEEHEEEFGHPVYDRLREEFVDFPVRMAEGGHNAQLS